MRSSAAVDARGTCTSFSYVWGETRRWYIEKVLLLPFLVLAFLLLAVFANAILLVLLSKHKNAHRVASTVRISMVPHTAPPVNTLLIEGRIDGRHASTRRGNRLMICNKNEGYEVNLRILRSEAMV